MAAEFDAFATRMTVPLSGLAQLLTGDREAAAALVHAALLRAYSERVPSERRAITGLVRAWLAGPPPVGEPEELSFDLELLRRSLDALPDKQLLAVTLHHWSGLSVPEIAAVVRRKERAVAADLAAGEAELHTPPDMPTVAARLAALVAAAGPPLVDVAEVAEAGRVQRRQRRRTAVVAGVVLLAVATVATLLMGSEPKRTFTATKPWARSDLPPMPVIDARARRLTAQLADALDEVLPDADLSPGPRDRPPLEFATDPQWGQPTSYVAEAVVGSTMLVLWVHFQDESADRFPPCTLDQTVVACTSREFPDGTVAEVTTNNDAGLSALSLLSQRPDGTLVAMVADDFYGPGLPAMTAEDLFRFATVLTY